MRPDNPITRKTLPHEPPHFIGTSDAVFFVTICCKTGGENRLCHLNVATILFEAVRYYEKNGDWYVHLPLLMPDHLHFPARFSDAGLTKIVRSWKRYTAKQAGVRWQRDFFDHRLRSDESFDAKATYIRRNPVRAGLIANPDDWIYKLEPI